MLRPSRMALWLTCCAAALSGCALRQVAPPPIVVTRVERVTIPAALLVCPDDPKPRPVGSQRDAAAIVEIALAALHACQANMQEIRKLQEGPVSK